MSFVSENRESPPILIVDKAGELGLPLCKKLSRESTVVFVSKYEPNDPQNIAYVPFGKEIPKVPDNTYSHVFIIDDGEDITFEYLSSFFEKAKSDKAVFCFCTNLQNQDKIPPEIFEYAKSKILVLGDLFPGKGFFSKAYTNRFLTQAQSRGKIEVPQDGMGITYPVFIDDAVLGILESAFGTSSEKTYYLFPKHGTSLLSLAHIIQKNDPSIKIDFSNEKFKKSTQIKKEGRYLLSEKYPLEERIKTLRGKRGQFLEKEEAVEDNDLNLLPTPYLKIFLFTIIFFLFLPLLTTLFFSFLGGFFLDILKSQNSNNLLSLSKSSYILANNFSKALLFENSFIKSDLINKLISSIDEGNLETENVLEYYKSLDLLSEGKTSEGISFLRNFLVFAQSKRTTEVIDKSLFNFISQTINVWPQILALDTRKNYLILFQNNNLPRPTGGQIQYFAVLSFDNGKISDFRTYDTKESDRKLKGHIEPPFAIRRFLKSPHWYLKDSNFNPDFIQSADSASFFVDLEESEKVDGVVAVDLNFLSQLLGKKITGQNLNAEVTRLKDSLKSKSLARTLLTAQFAKLLESKDIIFAFNDKSVQTIFSSNNFSSTISKTDENSPKKINDFLGVVEADFGEPINFVERKLNHKVEIGEDGKVASNVLFEIKNSEDTEYRNYIRFYTPQGSVLKKIKINGLDKELTAAITDPLVYEDKDFKASDRLEVESSNQSGKSVFGFFLSIPQNSTSTISISYESPKIESLSSLSNFSYNLVFFKQPGVEPYPYDFSISAPPIFKASKSTFGGNTAKDFDLTFNFGK